MSNDDTARIKALISGAPIGSIASVEHVGSGYASAACKVVSESGDFIALSQKSDAIAPPDFAYHFAILKTLESIDYRFAPKAIYINDEQSVILMTPVPGEPIGWINAAPEDQQKKVVETPVTALLDLRSAPFSFCAKIYKELTGKELEAITINKNVQIYMTDWFKLAQSGQPDRTLTNWIQPKVTACEEHVKHTRPGKFKVLIHGDTSEGNIFLTRDLQLHLIDWDGSSFDQFPEDWDDYGVSYLMNHVPIFQKFHALVISLVSERCQVSADELRKTVIRVQELIKLGDIQWAYMMHARAATGEIKSKSKEFFLSAAQERIHDYEEMFTGNSFLTS